MLVCEDVWHEAMSADLKSKAAQLVIVINASPFEADKLTRRREVVTAAAKQVGAPFIYANIVGAQDDIVFDGGSFAVSADGKLEAQLSEFEAALGIIEYENGKLSSNNHVQALSLEESLWMAMQLGLRDYVRKNGFNTVVLGLSGGIDSALTAALAVDALGPDHVKGVLLSSPYTSHESVEDALALAKLLDIETMNVPITAGMEIFEEVLSPVFLESGWMENPAIGGNLQSRLRGVSLMAISNNFGWLLLSTGNKSEVAVGYSTLYGDSCGAYNVLKDLYKTQVYALAHWRNGQKKMGGQVIPLRSITKAPTAELAPGQKDEDNLPPYATLDRILSLHIEGRQSADEIIAQGFERGVVEKVIRLVRINEYKRRQSCPGVKLSAMLFGKDRRFPLTNKY
jgi:NAD+ synthetase